VYFLSPFFLTIDFIQRFELTLFSHLKDPWNGIPAMARRVRWHLTDKEGIYRYGGGGGCFDVVHVETNEKETRVKKKHPYPETHEQCASRCGFGARRIFNVILRLRDSSLISGQTDCDGILEWPDYGGKSFIVRYLNCIRFILY